MMTFFSVVIVWLLFMSSGIWANSYVPVTGFGSSAQTIGRGDIYGFNDTAASVFENPASLSKINTVSVSGFTANLIDDIRFLNGALAYTTACGTFGLGYYEVGGSDSVSVQDGFGEFIPGQAFTFKRSQWTLSYANVFRSVRWGVSLHNFSDRIPSYNSSGVNADVGVLFPINDIEMSLTAKNVLPGWKFNRQSGNSETFPFSLVAGAKYKTSVGDVFSQIHTVEAAPRVLAAFSTVFHPTSSLDFALGWHEWYATVANVGPSSASTQSSIKNVWSLGMALHVEGAHLQYAYQKSELPEQNDTHYFSVSFELEDFLNLSQEKHR
jgi:hypothetical protein